MTRKKEKEYTETKPKDYCSYSGLASTSSYLDENKTDKRSYKRGRNKNSR